MRVGVVSVNLSFFQPLQDAFREAGHKIVHLSPCATDTHEAVACSEFKDKVDIIFGEFAQAPIERFLTGYVMPTYVRTHRIEMYNHLAAGDWSKCRIMFFSAEHVKDRFLKRCTKPPMKSVVSPTNLTESMMHGRRRRSRKPYRMLMVGRCSMKKRVYTAIQLMAPRLMSGEWEMWFVGNMNPRYSGYGNFEYPQNVKDLIDTLGVKRQIRQLGHLTKEDYKSALQACDMVLSMSNEEGTHVGVAEACAAGCVPVVSNWRGADKIYLNTFRTFEEFEDIVGQWEKADENGKERMAMLSSVHTCAKGTPKEEARKIVKQISEDAKEESKR